MPNTTLVTWRELHLGWIMIHNNDNKMYTTSRLNMVWMFQVVSNRVSRCGCGMVRYQSGTTSTCPTDRSRQAYIQCIDRRMEREVARSSIIK